MCDVKKNSMEYNYKKENRIVGRNLSRWKKGITTELQWN